MKIVKNVCFGGFSLSDKAVAILRERTGNPEIDRYYYDYTGDRSDPELVKVVEELGKEANGCCAELAVVEIPDDVVWTIRDYDGMETIEEVHRSW